MKKLNNFMLLLAAAVFTFTACEQDIKREPSPKFEGKAVFFPVSAESEEVEPTAVLQHEIKIARDTINSEALTIKLLVKENTQNIFEVPETFTFAKGVTEASFLVKFPKAQVDSTYNLAIELEVGNSNPYLTLKPIYSYTVNVAKWDLVTNKKAIVIDGLVNAFYGTGNPGWYVEYMRKNNADGSFDIRLLNPYTVLPKYEDVGGEPDYDSPIADSFGLYDGFPYNYPSDVDSKGTYNWTIHVAKNGKATFDDFDMGMSWSYGAFSAVYYDPTIPGVWNATDKSITFPAKSSACFMADYGGRLTSEDIIVFIDDSLWQDINSVITVASLKGGFNDASLTWNDIPGELSTLVTTIQPEEGLIDVLLQNCVDPNPKEKQGPGSDFYNLYRLADVYAPGYGLAFYIDTVKNKMSLPLSLQPTGLDFAGKAIYVGPSADKECYIEDAVLGGKQAKLFHFFLQLQTKNGGDLGVYEEVFYYCDEKIVWGEKAEDFVGTYLMTGTSPFDGTAVETDVEIAMVDSKLYLLGLKYCSGVAIDFDDVNKTISISPQLQDSLYDTYDIAVYTMDAAGSPSATAPIVFAMQFGGKLALTDDSPAIGYLTRSEAAGGWLDGAYDLALTPAAPAAPAAAPAKAPSFRVHNTITEIKHATTTKQNNWKILGQLPKHNFFLKQDAVRVF